MKESELVSALRVVGDLVAEAQKEIQKVTGLVNINLETAVTTLANLRRDIIRNGIEAD